MTMAVTLNITVLSSAGTYRTSPTLAERPVLSKPYVRDAMHKLCKGCTCNNHTGLAQ